MVSTLMQHMGWQVVLRLERASESARRLSKTQMAEPLRRRVGSVDLRGTWEAEFVISTQWMLMLLVWGPTLRTIRLADSPSSVVGRCLLSWDSSHGSSCFSLPLAAGTLVLTGGQGCPLQDIPPVPDLVELVSLGELEASKPYHVIIFTLCLCCFQ